MKIILTALAVFFSSGAFAYTDYTDAQRNKACAFHAINLSYYKVFKADLENRISQLKESETPFRASELLQPRPEFTKPHRVQLMLNFVNPRYVRISSHFIAYPYYPRGNDNLTPIVRALADKIIELSADRFGFDLSAITFGPDIGPHPACSIAGSLANFPSFETWQNPADRWWFNSSLKPLYEQMLNLGDFYDPDKYEPY